MNIYRPYPCKRDILYNAAMRLNLIARLDNVPKVYRIQIIGVPSAKPDTISTAEMNNFSTFVLANLNGGQLALKKKMAN